MSQSALSQPSALPPVVTAQRHSLEQIALWHFRHTTQFHLAPKGRPVLLGGANGSGKTNVLEAVSLFSPGRGVRQARAEQFLRRDSCPQQGWQIAARLGESVGGYRLKTGWQSGQNNRTVLIEDQRSTQQALGEYCRTLGLGPRDEHLFAQGAEGVRRFFDRLIAVFDPAHIGRVQALRQLQRHRRELILASRPSTSHWLRVIEQQLAAKLVVVSAARGQHARALAQACGERVADFVVQAQGRDMIWHLELQGDLQARLARQPAVEVEPAVAEALREMRQRSAHDPDCRDLQDVWSLELRNVDTTIPVTQLSHGQQKIAVLTMLLAQAWLMHDELGIVPILLLDEALSHLDQAHRILLFRHLRELDCQYWLSGVEATAQRNLHPEAYCVFLK